MTLRLRDRRDWEGRGGRAGSTEMATVVVAYAAFVLIGVSGGVTGVLLPAQIRDYGVDQATIGIAFFTGSAGFLLASTGSGALLHRYGTRTALVLGGAGFAVAGLCTAARPPLAVYLALQVLSGYGAGILESVLSAHLATLPRVTARMNRLHAFFGVGALAGPALATWILRFARWPAVWLVLGLAAVPLTLGFWIVHPGPGTVGAEPAPVRRPRLLSQALRRPGVLFGATLLAAYVGVELSLGNWGYSYLIERRGMSDAVAGYVVSGYWLGLTLGRFLLSPLANRIGLTAAGLMASCLTGVVAVTALTWLLPGAGTAAGCFAVLGFLLGPIFPTTMGAVPGLAPPHLVPTAIGIMNAGSVLGGSVLPWLAGTLAQGAGIATLLPYTLALAVIQLTIWWRMAES
ncbi:MAG: MFS transporter [Mycobacteriales bacterium]